MAQETVLVAVTDNAEDAEALSFWMSAQLPPGTVSVATGFYAAVAAIERAAPVVVVDVGGGSPRLEWQIAELRARLRRATIVVVAEPTHLSALAGALRADLAVASVSELPPLRELLLATEPALVDVDRGLLQAQTSRRRSTR